MKPESVVKWLERLSFEATEEWGKTWHIKINVQKSGLPQSVAQELTLRLNEAITIVRASVRKDVQNGAFKQLEIPGLGTAPVDNPVVGSDS
jgi:hypothetical protein